MENILTVNNLNEKVHALSATSDSTIDFQLLNSEQERNKEINQNYLKQPNGTESVLDQHASEQEGPLGQYPVQPNKPLFLEETKKRVDINKLTHKVIKPSFTVSAILERPDRVLEEGIKVKDSGDSTSLQKSEDLCADTIRGKDEVIDLRSKYILNETDVIPLSSQSKLKDIDLCNNIFNPADDGQLGFDESNKMGHTKSVDFTSFLRGLKHRADTEKSDQKSNSDAEIKTRQEEKDISENSQQRKVRKRKQERPQSISSKNQNVKGNSIVSDVSQLERKSKRKQTITKRYYRYDLDAEEDTSSEIKQTPLCSKLYSSSLISNVSHQSNLVDNEETSQSEDSNMPCTTNRYRRHFLKQVRNAEAAKAKVYPEQESTATVSEIQDYQEESDSDDDYFFDGKRVKMSDIESALDSNKCKVCAKEFSDIGTLMAHYICHSALEKEQVSLMDFQQSLAYSNTLESSTYFCHLCNQKFTDVSLLQEHVLTHSANFTPKPPNTTFECNLCMKLFATAGSLYLHKKSHTGDNPYTCRECNKHFRDKTRLTTHLRVHTGEKPFSCDLCSKKFSQKGNLKLHHQKIHLGQNTGKHRCIYCKINFSDKINLKEHIKKTHQTGTEKKDESGKLKPSFSQRHISSTDLQKPNTNDDSESKASSAEKSSTLETGKSGVDNAELILTVEDGEMENSNSSYSENSLVVDETPYTEMEDIREDRDQSVSGETGEKTDPGADKTDLLDGNRWPNFVCPTCNLQFLTVKTFNQHLLSHVNQGNTFYPVPSRFSMIAQSGSEFPSGVKKVYRCEECSLDFAAFPDFQSHLKSHKDNTSKVRFH